MGDKSAQKKKLIVERARRVFMEKGYKEVTMKDIVEECDISRGGLYLYFQNTREVFAVCLSVCLLRLCHALRSSQLDSPGLM